MLRDQISHRQLQELINAAGAEVIGQRIRRIRLRAKMTIRELADLAQVSKNTLLSLEHGKATHVSTVRVICRALKLKPEDITSVDFVQPAVVAVQRKADQIWHDMNTFINGIENAPITKNLENDPAVTPFCLLRSRFSDGRFNPNVVELNHATPSRSHRGEEFVYVLEGTLRVTVGVQVFELIEGDSICFWAAKLHNYEPIGDLRPTRILSIIIDPLPNLQKMRSGATRKE